MIDSPRAEPRAPRREPDLLTWDDLNVVIGLLAEVAPGWSADLNHASPNESTIVVPPEGATALIGPAIQCSATVYLTGVLGPAGSTARSPLLAVSGTGVAWTFANSGRRVIACLSCWRSSPLLVTLYPSPP